MTCDRGDNGKARREAANEKQREFYKTKDGIAMMKYREKAALKQKILNQLRTCDMHRETL